MHMYQINSGTPGVLITLAAPHNYKSVTSVRPWTTRRELVVFDEDLIIDYVRAYNNSYQLLALVAQEFRLLANRGYMIFRSTENDSYVLAVHTDNVVRESGNEN